MTQDELTKLINDFLPYPSEGQHHALRQFAKLVAQHEREACWHDISIALLGSDRELAKRVFKAIRARGQA